MSRLRSLQSPSPQPSPRPSGSPKSINTNPFPQDVTTYHRKLRALVGEVKATMTAWDEETREGFMAAKGMVDEGTEIDNILSLPPSPFLPSILPHLHLHQCHASSLVGSFTRLEKLLNKFRLLKDAAEGLMLEAGKLRGWEFVLGYGPAGIVGAEGGDADGMVRSAFWEGGTWSMDKFVDSIQPLPTIHATHLSTLTSLSKPISTPLAHLPPGSFASSVSKPTNGPTSGPSRPPPPTRAAGHRASTSSGPEEGTFSPAPTLPYDTHALFELQKSSLESWADAMGERTERARWRAEWLELVEGEMGGWVEG